MTEAWRPVVGYEWLYEVSDHGHVRSLGRDGVYRGRWGPCHMRFPARDMRISTTPTGYKYVALKHENQPDVKYLIHRLVMAAFVGPAGGLQVNHKDGDKSNNNIANLEYCTDQENKLHSTRVLGLKTGDRSSTAKLRSADIPKIRADTRTLKEIAGDYDVTLQAIWLVKKRRNWAHV